MLNSAVEVRDLTVVRGAKEVLHGLTFDIPRGSIVGLLGPSGCGKTTLMRCLVGVQVVKGGRATVLGHPAGSKALRHKVGYATQAPAVYDDLTVAENLRYFTAVLGAPKTDVRRVLEETGLEAEADQLAGSLSGGQHTRASLAVALLGGPELIVLDEPTVGLDPVLRQELWGLFHELAARGATLVVSSHVMDEAARCERLLLMRDGALLADLTPAELRSETGADDMEEAFLRLITRREAERQGTTS